MDENAKQNGSASEKPRRAINPLWVAGIALLCVVAVALGFIVKQQKVANQLSARNEELTASLTQTKGQLQTLSSELNTLQTKQAEQAERDRVEKAARQRRLYHHVVAKKVLKKDDPRWKQVQAELAAHQRAIASTQQDIDKTRSELQSNLDSTRTELNGSIAKTHAELVELEKKGERNYYEFDIFKAKRFERVGPIEVSLRKTNAKHQFCDMHVIVNDRELVKKHINVYEPVTFYTEQNGRPVQLVINSISKNHMHGYVSAPKYPGSRVSAANAAPVGAATGQTAVVDLRHRAAQ